ncbi:MAG: hypothetical protein IIW96_03680 [Oscillibacter sp.]|jgi:hypothetical protein|nr:hypothetical protein [Oscillibacter sp.]
MEKMDFGALLRRALDKMVEGEEGERLRALGYKGTWMDLLAQAQIEKAARGDSTAFRLVRDALAEGEEGVDIRQLTDAELRNLLEAEDG